MRVVSHNWGMSDKVFKYKILVEAFDKPLKDMQNALKSITDGFKQQREEIKKVTQAVDSLAGTYKKFEVGKMAFSGMKAGLSGVIGLAGKGIDMLQDLGASTLDAMQFRERSLFSLGRSFGDGNKALKEIINIAGRSTLDTRPMVEMANALSTSFESWTDVKKIITLGGDVLYQFPQLQEQFVSSFQKAGSGGMINAKSELNKAMKGGYNGYKMEIAKLLSGGKEITNVMKADELIKAAKQSGQLSGRILTQALVTSIKAGLKMKQLGDITIGAASGSLIGAVSNFRSAFDDVLIGIDWENMPGVKALKNFIVNITNEIKTEEFSNAVRDAINSFLEPLGKINSSTIHNLFSGVIIPSIRKAGEIARSAFGWLTDLLSGRESVGAGIRIAMLKLVNGLKDILIYLGELIGMGIKSVIMGGVETRSGKIERLEKEKKSLELPVVEHFRGSELERARNRRLEEVTKELSELTGETYESKSAMRYREELERMKEEQAAALLFSVNSSMKPPTIIFNSTFDLSNVKKEDAEHIANKVAEKVKDNVKSVHSQRRSAGR